MLIHHERATNTAVLRTFVYNTNHITGIMGQILVKPATETTTYDIKIVDCNGITILEETSESEPMAYETRIPVRGIYTVTVSNSLRNEEFLTDLIIEEIK